MNMIFCVVQSFLSFYKTFLCWVGHLMHCIVGCFVGMANAGLFISCDKGGESVWFIVFWTKTAFNNITRLPFLGLNLPTTHDVPFLWLGLVWWLRWEIINEWWLMTNEIVMSPPTTCPPFFSLFQEGFDDTKNNDLQNCICKERTWCDQRRRKSENGLFIIRTCWFPLDLMHVYCMQCMMDFWQTMGKDYKSNIQETTGVIQ